MSHMDISRVTTGKLIRPLRISLYGVDGVGKTSLAAGAPNPVCIATEDGTHHVNVARFPVPGSWLDIVGPDGAVAQLYTQDHDFKTVIVDSLDWAETLCDAHIVQQHNANNNQQVKVVTDIPYGAWKMKKMVAFTQLLDGLSVLVRERGMHAIVISHANIVRFDDPERDAYERYELKLFRDLGAKVREWADYNLFANYDTTVRQTGQGFNSREIGSSHGKRLLFSQRRAAYDAKARFPIPERLDITGEDPWGVFWAAHCQAAGLPQ